MKTMSKPSRVLLTPLASSDDQRRFVGIATWDPGPEEIVDTVNSVIVASSG